MGTMGDTSLIGVSPELKSTPTHRTRVLAIVSEPSTERMLETSIGERAQLTVVNDIAAAALAIRTSVPDVVLLYVDERNEDVVVVYHRIKAILPIGRRRTPLVVLGRPERLERLMPVLDEGDDVVLSPVRWEELMLRLDMRRRFRDRSMDGARVATHRYRVLIVDDMSANATLLEKYLEPEYDVSIAFDGPTALKCAAETHPDLILLDVRMPGMSGFEVCEALKRNEMTRFTPVIMVTANADDRASKIQGLEKGADDFLIKPIDWPELSARVRNLIRMKVLTQENLHLEREQQRVGIMREVIFAVSGGKLELADDEALERLRRQGRFLRQLEVGVDRDIARARSEVEGLLQHTSLDADRLLDLVLCVSEASTNAVKHAGGGILQIHESETSVLIWMIDNGHGIDFSLLPRSTLMKGWSSKLSLGCGFTIMLEMLDRLHLHTNKDGTTLILEMDFPRK